MTLFFVPPSQRRFLVTRVASCGLAFQAIPIGRTCVALLLCTLWNVTHNAIDATFVHVCISYMWPCVCRCSAQCLVRTAPPREYPRVLFIGLTRLWPHSFHKIMYLYSICLVSTTCCDATISQHKRNTNIQELHTLLNTLLALYRFYAWLY